MFKRILKYLAHEWGGINYKLLIKTIRKTIWFRKKVSVQNHANLVW